MHLFLYRFIILRELRRFKSQPARPRDTGQPEPQPGGGTTAQFAGRTVLLDQRAGLW
jgi:hypothetical protein